MIDGYHKVTEHYGYVKTDVRGDKHYFIYNKDRLRTIRDAIGGYLKRPQAIKQCQYLEKLNYYKD